MTVDLHHGDMRTILPTLPAASIDACVTDPPYGLGFMARAWDAPDNVAFRPDTWRAVLRVLKPGAHLVAFGGTRTWHRMACAIEDAGFEVRDTVAWLYGSGFPKSLDVGKALDTAPATDLARRWQGWGTALKPSFEPAILARKPLAGTVAANVAAHGCGALNVDGCRIAAPDGVPEFDKSNKRPGNTFDVGSNRTGAMLTAGRWPANVCHDGSDEVLAGFPVTASGFKVGGQYARTSGVHDGGQRADGAACFADSGSAARFFYCAKATDADRLASRHPTVKPVALMRWLVRLVTPPGGRVLDPFAGSGTTGMACLAEGFDATLIEREAEYADDIRRRLAHVAGADQPLFAGVPA